MPQIRWAMMKFLEFLLLGSIFPILILLILAAINAKVRRFFLWLMIPTAIVAVITYIAFAWMPSGEINNLQDALDLLSQTITAAVPFLLFLLIIGAAAYLLAPAAFRVVKEKNLQAQRREYLNGILRWAKPQLVSFVPLEGRTFSLSTPFLRMVGPAGAGKSVLLRALLADLAQNALEDKTQPIPVLVDIDRMPHANAEVDQRILASLLPPRAADAASLLQHETRARRIALLIDASAQTFAPAFTTAEQRKTILDHLIYTIESFDPVRLVIALPPGMESGSLERLAPEVLVLEPSDPIWVSNAIRAIGGQKTESAAAVLLDPGAGWSTLAGRTMILSAAARYTAKHGQAPGNAKELFRAIYYPAQPAPEKLEAALRSLAYEMVQRETTALKREEAAILLRPFSPADMQNYGFIIRLDSPDRLAFTHPVFFAYFAALAWEAGQPFQQGILEKTDSDPILALAIQFFNNITGSSEQLARMVENLNSRSDPGAQYLAAQCLLALPASQRPPELVQETGARLVRLLAGDVQAAPLARKLLEPVDSAVRVRVYEQSLAGMNLTEMEAVLLQIYQQAPGDVREILCSTSMDTARFAGEVYASTYPREMAQLFRECYMKGQPDRQGLFIELMGFLPEEACAPFLAELFKSQTDPRLRVSILRSMANAGVEMIMTLLEVLADPQETAEVRVTAAQILANSRSTELHSVPVTREMVRISRMPLPNRARETLLTLLDSLREHPSTGQVDRWEVMLNPFQPGRPLTNRDLFFGREKVIRSLRSALENGTHIHVTGESQIGKTTLLRQFALRLEDEAASGVPVRAAYLSLEGLQANEFFETIIREVIGALKDPQLVADGEVSRPYQDGQFERDLEELGGYLKASRGVNFRLALLFDDGDCFLEYPLFIHAGLRRILVNPSLRFISLVLTGSNLLEGWRQPQLPFYSTFQTITLGRLTKEDAIRLASQPIASTYQYEPEALDLVAQFTQGKPGEIHALCQRLVSDLIENGEKVITSQLVREKIKGQDRIRVSLISETDRLLDALIDWLQAHPDASQPDVEEMLKQTWEKIGKAMVHSVKLMRKKV